MDWIRQHKEALIISGVGLLIVTLLWTFLPRSLGSSYTSLDDRGALGDTYGPVTALFTGFALIALIVTISLQTKELRLQKDELKQGREELELTRKEIKKQGETFELQRFESTLFHLIKVLVDGFDGLSWYSNGPIVTGSRAVKEIVAEFRGTISNALRDKEESSEEVSGPDHRLIIQDAFSSVALDMMHCIRQVNAILKFINESDIDRKQQYANFLKVQLSSDFLTLLAYHYIYFYLDYQYDGLVALIDEYEILDRMNPHALVDTYHRQIIYRDRM